MESIKRRKLIFCLGVKEPPGGGVYIWNFFQEEDSFSHENFRAYTPDEEVYLTLFPRPPGEVWKTIPPALFSGMS